MSGELPGNKGKEWDAAFSEFYRAAFARLVVKCVMLGVPQAKAVGTVQEVMLEIYRRWPEIESPAAYASFAVPRRAATLAAEISSPARRFAWHGDNLLALARLGQPLTVRLRDVVLIREEELVLKALAQLPSMQRAVFALVYDGRNRGRAAD